MSASRERRLLQIAIVVAGFVPVCGGLMGALLGAGMTGEPGASLSIDSHMRYLSGLLLGIGLAFWESVPQIERHGPRIRMLSAFVVLGGLMRLVGVIFVGVPRPAMLFGLAMELGVTPLLALWQRRVARRCAAASRTSGAPASADRL